ncbi:MAG: hypothetical protein AAF799_26405 [Myxococcota bacterium]
MKLARNVVAPAILLGLCVGFAGGCGPKKPPGTNPPGEPGAETGGDDGGASSDGGAATDGGETTDGGGAAEGGAPTDGGASGPPTCEAKVADTPTLLFNDKVIFRPPPGVEFALDGNPTFVQAAMSGGFVTTCDATVKRVLIWVFGVDKKKNQAKVVDEMIESLEPQGYKGGKKSAPLLDNATDYHVTVDYGGGGGGEAVTLYVAVARRGDTDFVIIYEAAPADAKGLQPTFMESAKSLFIVPD